MVTRFIDALDASNAVIATHTETNDAIMSWNIPTIFPSLTPGVTYNFVMRTPETADYASFSPLALGAKLLFWFDASDKSTLWQDVAQTNPVTASGQTVARIRDKSANNYFMDRRAAGTGVYTESGGNSFIAQNGDGSGYSLNSTISGLTSTCEFFNVIRTSDSSDVVAGANSASGSITFGRIAGFSATAVGMTTPTYYKNGANIGVITSGNTLRSQLVTGSWVQFGAVPVDMTGAAWTSFWPMTNPAFGPGSMNGDWMHIVLTTQLTELERLQLQTWLQNQVNPL